MVWSENKTLREEEREKIKGRDERFLYTRWPKSSPGLDFGRSLTRHGPASLDSTASKGASLDSIASKGAAATASKGAPATASKGAPATASKGAVLWRSVCVVVWTLGQLHSRAVTVMSRHALGTLLAARSHHEDFASYYERFQHQNVNLRCSCRARKTSEHSFLCK